MSTVAIIGASVALLNKVATGVSIIFNSVRKHNARKTYSTTLHGLRKRVPDASACGESESDTDGQ